MRLSTCRLMPVSNNKIYRPRNFNLKFSNAWHKACEVEVKDEGYRAACESRGIKVYKPEEVLRPYLPDMGLSEEELEFHKKKSPVAKAFEDFKEHPLYHEVPCKTFSAMSRLIKYAGLDQAKCLTNTVEIEQGLPKSLQDKIDSIDGVMPQGEELMHRILKDSRVFDATQKKLPKNVAVPNINWNPVLDRMHRPLPYEEGDFSWGYNTRVEYGIPLGRKSMSLIRGMYHSFDFLAIEYPSLLNRQHFENVLLRQFFERDGHKVRVASPLFYLVTDEKPLQPYAPKEAVDSTTSLELPDLSPLNSLSYLFDNHIYRDMNNFPVKDTIKNISSLSVPHIHTCFEINLSVAPVHRLESEYQGRSLIMAFAAALGQARLLYGPDVKGVLPQPVTVHFVNGDGSKFHFSVFQLNTLDLDGKVKNIFWHEPEFEVLFSACEYKDAIPTLEGYNHNVFNRLLAMYLQNAS